MKCTRCHNGPIEYIYRINWTDYYYCTDCNLENAVDILRQTDLIDHNIRQEESYGE